MVKLKKQASLREISESADLVCVENTCFGINRPVNRPSFVNLASLSET